MASVFIFTPIIIIHTVQYTTHTHIKEHRIFEKQLRRVGDCYRGVTRGNAGGRNQREDREAIANRENNTDVMGYTGRSCLFHVCYVYRPVGGSGGREVGAHKAYTSAVVSTRHTASTGTADTPTLCAHTVCLRGYAAPRLAGFTPPYRKGLPKRVNRAHRG